MSRVGKYPVAVPAGVDITLEDTVLTAKGKQGTLSLPLHDAVTVTHEDGKITVTPKKEDKKSIALWGTMRSRINGLLQGVAAGFTRKLEVNGVGYRAQVQGTTLVLQLGYSHDINFPIPEGLKITCEKPTEITIFGADKQLVGQTAAIIRGMRPPEPYKGKGVKYAEETILRKEGKKK